MIYQMLRKLFPVKKFCRRNEEIRIDEIDIDIKKRLHTLNYDERLFLALLLLKDLPTFSVKVGSSEHLVRSLVNAGILKEKFVIMPWRSLSVNKVVWDYLQGNHKTFLNHVLKPLGILEFQHDKIEKIIYEYLGL